MIHHTFMSTLKYYVSLFLLFLLFISASCSIGEIYQQSIGGKGTIISSSQASSHLTINDFYFIHITDTHIMHKLYDPEEVTTIIFKTAMETITSFSEKPAFVVITGDLVEWGGSGLSGALNYKALVDCLYKNNDQFFADASYTIPVYTTPGNHDYNFNRNLSNYHRLIDNAHVSDHDRYVLTYNDMSLFFMDSGPNYYADPTKWFHVLGDGLYDEDIQWLEGGLQQCNSQQKIVLMHHPAINDRNDQGRMEKVIARNREVFISLCQAYDVEAVLTGHTHHARVFDGNENRYDALPLNCSQYPTLFVQTDDCKQGCHYRNISIRGDDVWLEDSVELQVTDIQCMNEPDMPQDPCLISSANDNFNNKQHCFYSFFIYQNLRV